MTKQISKLSDLVPDRHNANKGTERGQYMIESSLRKVGAGRSVVVDKDGRIIAGNKTVENWADIADSDDIEVVQTDGRKLVVVQRTDLDLDDAENTTARELAYYDNRSSEVSLDWDAEVLLADLNADIPLDDFFREEELTELLADIEPEQAGTDTEPEISRAYELREQWGTELGQLWQCGPHRVICGDCTDSDVVDRLMDGEKAEILITSPPYSDQREYSGNDLSISTLAQIFQEYRDITRFFIVNLGIKHKEKSIDCYWDEWIYSAVESGLKLLSWNVWDKINSNSVRSQMSMFAIQHEWIFVFGDSPKALNRTWEKSSESKKKEKYYRVNERGQKVVTRRQADGSVSESIIGNIYDNKQMGTVNTFYAEMSRKITSHPAIFPVDLPQSYVEAMTNSGDIVIDPFLGSGTTLIAAHNLNRICYGCEISPAYVAVILQRFQDHTGIEPELLDN